MARQSSTRRAIAHFVQTNQAVAGIAGAAVIAASLVPTAGMAAITEGQIVCYPDRPCIERAASQGSSIQVHWRDSVSYDFYQVRWSRPGKDESQVQLDGGQSGSLSLDGVVPNTRYVFKLRGCTGRIFGGPTCTEWEVQELMTGEAVAGTPAQIAPEAETAPTATPAAEAKPVEVKPVEAKPIEVKPMEAKPVEAKPVEAKPVEAKPSSVQPANAPSFVVPTQ